jgi:hypothetical protein
MRKHTTLSFSYVVIFGGAGLALATTGCSSGPAFIGNESPDGAISSTSGSSVSTSSSSTSGSSSSSSDDGGGASNLQWWMTCGDPVCRAPLDGGTDAGLTADAGTPCPALGTSCSTSGETCGTRDSAIACGAIEECSATDPTKGFGGCPVSSRRFKENVSYLDDAQLDMVHDEALHIRLATYNYKAQFDDPTRRHLGFIVEDDPRSPAVDRPYDRVDMYGYVSMLVATTQVQEKEIAALRQDLDAMRANGCGPSATSHR